MSDRIYMRGEPIRGVVERDIMDRYDAPTREAFEDVQEMASAGREIQFCLRDGNVKGELDEWAHVKRIAERAIARRKANGR